MTDSSKGIGELVVPTLKDDGTVITKLAHRREWKEGSKVEVYLQKFDRWIQATVTEAVAGSQLLRVDAKGKIQFELSRSDTLLRRVKTEAEKARMHQIKEAANQKKKEEALALEQSKQKRIEERQREYARRKAVKAATATESKATSASKAPIVEHSVSLIALGSVIADQSADDGDDWESDVSSEYYTSDDESASERESEDSGGNLMDALGKKAKKRKKTSVAFGDDDSASDFSSDSDFYSGDSSSSDSADDEGKEEDPSLVVISMDRGGSSQVDGRYHFLGMYRKRPVFGKRGDDAGKILYKYESLWCVEYDGRDLYISHTSQWLPPSSGWDAIDDGQFPAPGVVLHRLSQKTQTNEQKMMEADRSDKDDAYVPVDFFTSTFDPTKALGFTLKMSDRNTQLCVDKVKDTGQALAVGLRTGDLFVKVDTKLLSVFGDVKTAMLWLRDCLQAKKQQLGALRMVEFTFGRAKQMFPVVLVNRPGVQALAGKYSIHGRHADAFRFIHNSEPTLAIQRIFYDLDKDESVWIIRKHKKPLVEMKKKKEVASEASHRRSDEKTEDESGDALPLRKPLLKSIVSSAPELRTKAAMKPDSTGHKVELDDPRLAEDRMLTDAEVSALLVKLCLSDSLIRTIRALIKSEARDGVHTSLFRKWLEDLTVKNLHLLLLSGRRKDKVRKMPSRKIAQKQSIPMKPLPATPETKHSEEEEDEDSFDPDASVESVSIEWSESEESTSSSSTSSFLSDDDMDTEDGVSMDEVMRMHAKKKRIKEKRNAKRQTAARRRAKRDRPHLDYYCALSGAVDTSVPCHGWDAIEPDGVWPAPGLTVYQIPIAAAKLAAPRIEECRVAPKSVTIHFECGEPRKPAVCPYMDTWFTVDCFNLTDSSVSDVSVVCQQSPAVFNGLVNGNAYQFRINSHCEVSRVSSARSERLTPLELPNAPKITDIKTTETSLTLEWACDRWNDVDVQASMRLFVTPALAQRNCALPVKSGTHEVGAEEWSYVELDATERVHLSALECGLPYTVQLKAVNCVAAMQCASEAVIPAMAPPLVRIERVVEGNREMIVDVNCEGWDQPKHSCWFEVDISPNQPTVADLHKLLYASKDATAAKTHSTTRTAAMSSRRFGARKQSIFHRGQQRTLNRLQTAGKAIWESVLEAMADEVLVDETEDDEDEDGDDSGLREEIAAYKRAVRYEALPIILQPLVNGQEYTVSVRVRNYTASHCSGEIEGIIPRGVPPIPRFVKLTPKDGCANMKIVCDDYSTKLYRATYEFLSLPKTGRKVKSQRFDIKYGGLNNGSEYRFKVRGVNIEGKGPYSEVSMPVIPQMRPRPCVDVRAVPGNGQVSLFWVADDVVNDASTNGWFEVNTKPATYTLLCKRQHCVFKGLQNGKAHMFRVFCANTTGRSQWRTVLSDSKPTKIKPKSSIKHSLYARICKNTKQSTAEARVSHWKQVAAKRKRMVKESRKEARKGLVSAFAAQLMKQGSTAGSVKKKASTPKRKKKQTSSDSWIKAEVSVTSDTKKKAATSSMGTKTKAASSGDSWMKADVSVTTTVTKVDATSTTETKVATVETESSVKAKGSIEVIKAKKVKLRPGARGRSFAQSEAEGVSAPVKKKRGFRFGKAPVKALPKAPKKKKGVRFAEEKSEDSSADSKKKKMSHKEKLAAKRAAQRRKMQEDRDSALSHVRRDSVLRLDRVAAFGSMYKGMATGGRGAMAATMKAKAKRKAKPKATGTAAKSAAKRTRR